MHDADSRSGCARGWWSGWGAAGGWFIVMWVMVNGCATTPAPPAHPHPLPPIVDHQPAHDAQTLRSAIASWLGTPHRLGGMSRRGIDCSGLVVVVYDELFDMQLPRTTGKLIRSGRPVEKDNLVAGDLVFFNPGYKKRHVGIYLGKGEFAHASTSRGVMISHLDDRFWRRCYLTGRRLR